MLKSKRYGMGWKQNRVKFCLRCFGLYSTIKDNDDIKVTDGVVGMKERKEIQVRGSLVG
jgi:hypothetical protein